MNFSLDSLIFLCNTSNPEKSSREVSFTDSRTSIEQLKIEIILKLFGELESKTHF